MDFVNRFDCRVRIMSFCIFVRNLGNVFLILLKFKFMDKSLFFFFVDIL